MAARTRLAETWRKRPTEPHDDPSNLGKDQTEAPSGSILSWLFRQAGLSAHGLQR